MDLNTIRAENPSLTARRIAAFAFQVYQSYRDAQGPAGVVGLVKYLGRIDDEGALLGFVEEARKQIILYGDTPCGAKGVKRAYKRVLDTESADRAKKYYASYLPMSRLAHHLIFDGLPVDAAFMAQTLSEKSAHGFALGLALGEAAAVEAMVNHEDLHATGQLLGKAVCHLTPPHYALAVESFRARCVGIRHFHEGTFCLAERQEFFLGLIGCAGIKCERWRLAAEALAD